MMCLTVNSLYRLYMKIQELAYDCKFYQLTGATLTACNKCTKHQTVKGCYSPGVACQKKDLFMLL